MRGTETAPRAGLKSPCPQIEGKTALGRPYAAQEVIPARPRGGRGVRLPPREHGATDTKRLSEPWYLTKDAIDYFAIVPDHRHRGFATRRTAKHSYKSIGERLCY